MVRKLYRTTRDGGAPNTEINETTPIYEMLLRVRIIVRNMQMIAVIPAQSTEQEAPFVNSHHGQTLFSS